MDDNNQFTARAVLRLADVEDFCQALGSGLMPTAGVSHYDLRVEAGEVDTRDPERVVGGTLVVRGTLEAIAAVSSFLSKEGVLA